jgi:hypothetical protein
MQRESFAQAAQSELLGSVHLSMSAATRTKALMHLCHHTLWNAELEPFPLEPGFRTADPQHSRLIAEEPSDRLLTVSPHRRDFSHAVMPLERAHPPELTSRLVNFSYTRTTELSEIINLANFFLCGTAGCGTTITPGWPSNSRWIVPALVAQSLPISSTEYVRSVSLTLVAHVHHVQRVKAIAVGNVAIKAPVQPKAGRSQP